jgi:hypothetical protein
MVIVKRMANLTRRALSEIERDMVHMRGEREREEQARLTLSGDREWREPREESPVWFQAQNPVSGQTREGYGLPVELFILCMTVSPWPSHRRR